jgi:hypothetical protein
MNDQGFMHRPLVKKERNSMEKYENKSLKLRRHLKNALEYMKYDKTNFPLKETVSFLQNYIDGLEQWDLMGYDLWLEDQKQNAEVS